MRAIGLAGCDGGTGAPGGGPVEVVDVVANYTSFQVLSKRLDRGARAA